MLISKFMTSSTGKLIITINVLPNLARSKGNHTVEFGQLLECNMNIFLKSHTQNVVENVSISLVQQSETLNSLFLLYIQVEDYQNILKLRY